MPASPGEVAGGVSGGRGDALRIALVCPYALSRPGGVQGQVKGLARALRERGHEATVLAPGDGILSGPGGSVVTVGRPVGIRSNGSVAPVSVSPLAAGRVVGWVRRNAPDVVHLHEPLAPVLGYGCLVRRPAPLVGTYHRCGPSGWYRLLGPVARWASTRLDVACAVSDAARDTAVAAVGGEVEVLFNGVEVNRFVDVVPWPADRPTALFIGRHETRKGLAVLLEAFASVPEPAVLWVVGDGPVTGELRRRYPESDRLRWLGVVDDEEVARRLAGADVLCAPSLFGESFGMVLVEAMAAGCAVVASDIDGYRDASAGHATLVPPGDPSALARAVTAVLAGRDSEAARAGRRAAFDHAQRWSMDRLADRYETVYRQAIAVGEGRRGGGNLVGP
jgi:phosphatidylinositol alpha-mannosyltransferase